MQESHSRYWNLRRLGLATLAAVVMLPTGMWFGGAMHTRSLFASNSLAAFDLSDMRVLPEHIVQGAPIDGIPSLTMPLVVPMADASYLRQDDRVIGVVIDGVPRAYPLRILSWHEIVNDELAGEPIAVVYCPLGDSVTVAHRKVGQDVLEFGVSGFLYESNLLLYDRTERGLWSQLAFTAVSGPRAGTNLVNLGGWELTTVAAWTARHPDSTVLSDRTRYPRDYSSSPYESYLAGGATMFPVSRESDALPARTRIVGVLAGNRALAYPVEAIRQAPGGEIREQIGDEQIVLRVDEDGTISVDAPPNTAFGHAFWFAWYAFHPASEIRPTDPHLPI